MPMNLDGKDEGKPLGYLAYVVGGMSFFPLLGVAFGLIAIVWGLAARRRGGAKLAIVGAAGIAFTFIIYGALFYSASSSAAASTTNSAPNWRRTI
jgi:hypothetical protein